MRPKLDHPLAATVRLALACVLPLLLAACPEGPAEGPGADRPGAGDSAGVEPASQPSSQPSGPAPVRLPAFEDYAAAEAFAGSPAAVDLASHPDGTLFRTALTRDAEAGAVKARFAGHYRIVVIGCGTTCQAVWAVDLADGSLHNLFTASVGVVYRPDSQLIVENDPAYYEGLVGEMTVAEVEELMELYGPPRFWLESDGEFARIGPSDLRLDPASGKIVPASP